MTDIYNEVQQLREAAMHCRAEAKTLSTKFDGRHKAALMARARRFDAKASKIKEAIKQASWDAK
jgi:hypothetical protein